MVTFFQVCMKYYYFFPYKIIIQLSPEVEVMVVMTETQSVEVYI